MISTKCANVFVRRTDSIKILTNTSSIQSITIKSRNILMSKVHIMKFVFKSKSLWDFFAFLFFCKNWTSQAEIKSCFLLHNLNCSTSFNCLILPLSMSCSMLERMGNWESEPTHQPSISSTIYVRIFRTKSHFGSFSLDACT